MSRMLGRVLPSRNDPTFRRAPGQRRRSCGRARQPRPSGRARGDHRPVAAADRRKQQPEGERELCYRAGHGRAACSGSISTPNGRLRAHASIKKPAQRRRRELSGPLTPWRSRVSARPCWHKKTVCRRPWSPSSPTQGCDRVRRSVFAGRTSTRTRSSWSAPHPSASSRRPRPTPSGQSSWWDPWRRTSASGGWPKVRPAEGALVFARSDGGCWSEDDFRNWRRRRLSPAAEAIGLDRLVPYDLRHSFCSLLIHEGMSPVDVAAQAGHAPSMSLDTYGHIFAELRGSDPRSAEELIRQARRSECVRSVSARRSCSSGFSPRTA